jgi:hypothetical protein
VGAFCAAPVPLVCVNCSDGAEVVKRSREAVMVLSSNGYAIIKAVKVLYSNGHRVIDRAKVMV